jgi:nucleotide-binding universal stress UspA family protein
MVPVRCILAPTDFSEHSKAAFHLAVALARDHGAKLIVLHVREAPVPSAAPFGTVPSREEAAPSALEDKFVDFKMAHDAVPIEYLVVSGAAVPEILRIAAAKHCDLIVMGTHGRTGLGRLLIGSIAEEIMRKAPCAVLILKQPMAAEALQVAAGQEF